MRLECSDGAFGGIASVHVGWHQLEFGLPFLPYLLLVCLAALIVQNLEVDSVSAAMEAFHDLVGCGKAMAVVLRLEGLDEDGIRIGVVGKHDVVVAAPGAHREPASVVGVELAD